MNGYWFLRGVVVCALIFEGGVLEMGRRPRTRKLV